MSRGRYKTRKTNNNVAKISPGQKSLSVITLNVNGKKRSLSKRHRWAIYLQKLFFKMYFLINWSIVDLQYYVSVYSKVSATHLYVHIYV